MASRVSGAAALRLQPIPGGLLGAPYGPPPGGYYPRACLLYGIGLFLAVFVLVLPLSSPAWLLWAVCGLFRPIGLCDRVRGFSRLLTWQFLGRRDHCTLLAAELLRWTAFGETLLPSIAADSVTPGSGSPGCCGPGWGG